MKNEWETLWESAWLNYTDHGYYNHARGIMLNYGMGEGDVETILAKVWESGFIAGFCFRQGE